MDWISVKDKLPDHKNKNIVCLINNEPIICQVHNATLTLTNNIVSFYYPTEKWIKDIYFSDVTHWMPLPESPK